ncbi:MAG: hypothetical protein AB1578_21270 [Thermodesulfobacteriota bacterium]
MSSVTGSLPLRVALSGGLLGLLLWGGWAYLGLPLRVRPAAPPPVWEAPLPSHAYHAPHRFQVEPLEAGPESPCLGCHPNPPHWRSPVHRAFLNLHVSSLDCGVCHLKGAPVSVRRFRGGEVVTRDGLLSGEGGRLYAAVGSGQGWSRVLGAGPAVGLADRGPRCSQCHRRGSTLLATDGLYDAYRRRVLEDLAVLRHLGERPW